MAPVDDDIGADGFPSDDASLSQRKKQAFRAIAAAVARSGYDDTSVADVLRISGMSPQSFSELFDTLEDCFLQAFDDAVERARLIVCAAYHSTAEWSDLRKRVEFALGAFLDCCAQEPDLARMCIVDVLAAGPAARARRDAAVLGFARFIDSPRQEARGTAAPSLVSEAIAGGICGVVYTRLARGEAAGLPALLGELMDSGLAQLLDAGDR